MQAGETERERGDALDDSVAGGMVHELTAPNGHALPRRHRRYSRLKYGDGDHAPICRPFWLIR